MHTLVYVTAKINKVINRGFWTMGAYKPSWNRDVSPYLIINNVEAQIKFMQQVFGAEIIEAPKMNGKVFHAELKLGDSVVMVGQASGKDYPARQGNTYVYVADVQKVYDTAIKHGAKGVMEPTETPWGNMDSGFDDPQGNRWWVAKLIKPMTEQQITDAMKES